MSTLCIILARGGSKGLPGKNLARLAGQPMVAHTIDHALAATRLDTIVLSTDSADIAHVGRERGVDVILRPAGLASDTATVDSAARHAVTTIEARLAPQGGRPFDHIVILYGNVPVRPQTLIDEAIAKLIDTGCDSVQSVAPVGKMHPYWMKRIEGDDRDLLLPYVDNNIYRRQDLPPVYMLDGGIIAVTRASLFTVADGQPHAFLGSDRRAIVNDAGDVVDIDVANDLLAAKTKLEGGAKVDNIKIGNRTIGAGQPVFTIAELGVNHDGELDRALELVTLAKGCGADAVKVQLFDASLLMSGDAQLADYQRAHEDDPVAMLQRLQLSTKQLRMVRDYAAKLELAFIATIFSIESIDDLLALDVDAVKTASPDAVNTPLLEAVAATGLPMLISTGTCTIDELHQSLRTVRGTNFALLHCVSAYPVPPEQANLARIRTLTEAFGVPIGYSDHVDDLHAGALSVATGASFIERHLTYDRAAKGPDHAASSDGEQFKQYIAMIRQAERMRGDGNERRQPVEADVARVSRQSLCVVRDLPAGHVLTRDDLTVKRPGTGIPAAMRDQLVGRRLARAVQANRLLRLNDVCTDDASLALGRKFSAA